jgi:hypothetical protein
VSAQNNCLSSSSKAPTSTCISITDSATTKTHGQSEALGRLLKLPGKVDDDYKITNKFVVSNEAMFHLSERVNRLNLLVVGRENSRDTFYTKRDSQNINVFASILTRKTVRDILLFGAHRDRNKVP